MTPPAPTRATPGGRAYHDLRNLARREQRDPAELISLYALEGFLARLARSDVDRAFVLKGGVLMAAFAARRPTRDIDLAAVGVPRGIPEVERRLRDVARLDLDDGLVFDPTSVRGGPIREEGLSSGVRVRMTAQLASARIALHVDVNFGDPIWPRPTEATLPLLLGGELRLPGYPDHMVLAEKIVTALDRGELNTRWRDFVDIAALAATRRITYADQRAAMTTVAEHRGVVLRPLAPLMAGLPQLAQGKWATWRRKQRLEPSTPELFVALLESCLAYAEPVLTGEARGGFWEPSTWSWVRPSGSAPSPTG